MYKFHSIDFLTTFNLHAVLTYVSIFVFALGAAAHITDGPDVLLLKT